MQNGKLPNGKMPNGKMENRKIQYHGTCNAWPKKFTTKTSYITLGNMANCSIRTSCASIEKYCPDSDGQA